MFYVVGVRLDGHSHLCEEFTSDLSAQLDICLQFCLLISLKTSTLIYIRMSLRTMRTLEEYPLSINASMRNVSFVLHRAGFHAPWISSVVLSAESCFHRKDILLCSRYEYRLASL